MKIKKQTLGGPLLETFLYITVFGAALGSRIKELHGIEYIVFVIPGLIMMSFATNAFTNNSSSILQQKFLGAIQDQLSSPASPRSCCSPSPRRLRPRPDRRDADLHRLARPGRPARRPRARADPGALPGRLLLLQLGVLTGVRAEQFDDVAFAQTFVLQPLIFLGGVFYSASLLPQPFETLTQFNPIYYMINLVRYGFVGFTEVRHSANRLCQVPWSPPRFRPSRKGEEGHEGSSHRQTIPRPIDGGLTFSARHVESRKRRADRGIFASQPAVSSDGRASPSLCPGWATWRRASAKADS